MSVIQHTPRAVIRQAEQSIHEPGTHIPCRGTLYLSPVRRIQTRGLHKVKKESHSVS